MTNRKSTKRALLGSVMAMVLCLAMLVGATFAWFTDTASTGVNKIQAGNLDIEIQDENGKPVTNLSWVKAEGAEGEQVLWEPGCTYELTPFQIVNKGNLALKYKIVVTGLEGDAGLLKVIKFTYKTGEETFDMNTEGHLTANGGASKVITVSAHMDEAAGNEYMNKTLEGVKFTVYATQDTVESDSFNNTYDANAQYPAMPYVTSHEALNTNLTLADIPTNEATGKHDPVEVALGNTDAGDIAYSEHSSGYTGKGVMLGSTKLNSYAAAPAKAGESPLCSKTAPSTAPPRAIPPSTI